MLSESFGNMENMPVCKIDFDLVDDMQYSAYSNYVPSPNKSNCNIDMDDLAEIQAREFLSNNDEIKHSHSNGRLLFSPRKPIRNSHTTADHQGRLHPRSFKGYTSSPSNSISPPEKKIGQLRLFDIPNTPKTLIQNSVLSTPTDRCNSIFVSKQPSITRPATRSRLFAAPTTAASKTSSNGGFLPIQETNLEKCAADSPNAETKPKEKEEAKNMRANVNPFTPTNIMMSSKKRSRKSRKLNTSKGDDSFAPLGNNSNNFNHDSSMETTTTEEDNDDNNNSSNHNNHHNISSSEILSSDECIDGEHMSEEEDDYNSDDDDDDDSNPCKRIAIHEVNVFRYNKEFAEISVIGQGVFGSVYLVRHRLDGCLYAVKRSLKPVAGSSVERTALNEVYAHAVLGAHQHVVRYYSAWAEDDHMIIQNEYCNGGSLANTIASNGRNQRTFTEEQVKTILLHLAKGLKFIHSLHMVHMDLKPDNIFISCDRSKRSTPSLSSLSPQDSADDGFEEIDDHSTRFTYKIGDLGHVTSVMNPKVEEGDCRYMPRELLQDDYSSLQKVDIFALGLTLLEAATNHDLPLNGPEWQSIRDGQLPEMPGFSTGFQDLLKLMTHSDPKMRPTASQLINHEVFNVASTNGTASKSRGQLSRELEEAQLKNEMLEKKLQQANYVIKHLSPMPRSTINGTPTGAASPYSASGASPNFLRFNGNLGIRSIADSTSFYNSTLGFDSSPSSDSKNMDSLVVFGSKDQSCNFSNMFSQFRSSKSYCSERKTAPPTPTNKVVVSRLTGALLYSQDANSEDTSKTSMDSSNLFPIRMSSPNQQSPHVTSTQNQQEQLVAAVAAVAAALPQQQQKQYHYNTRSQQQLLQRKQKLQAQQHTHGRYVGKKAGRSQSVM